MTARYVAFNPSSSETSEFVEANTLREILQQLAYRGFISVDSHLEAMNALQRGGVGRWTIESIEVYELRLHPRLREQVNQWRTVTA